MNKRSLALAVSCLAFLGAHLRAGPADKRLDIYWADTEGGAATLIVTPAGESVLIDSGNAGERDAGRIFKIARSAGLKQIDFLVTTHYHGDHFGGAATLATVMPIITVYDNGEFKGGRERPSNEYLQFKAAKRMVLNPGDLIPLRAADGAPPMQLRCLAARKGFVDPPAGVKENELCATGHQKPPDLTDNANSIVQILSFGDFRFFDGGDLTWNMESKLACPVNLVGHVDVYQVDHHGLDVSNNPLLVQSLAPTIAVMSNGPNKGCEPETVKTLRAVKSIQSIYQLHRNLKPGAERSNAPAAFIANESDKCEGNHVKLSVDPTGKTYTVTVAGTRHERTYQTRREAAPRSETR